jgi:antitoxin component YwqK of YwqJK toxin-antitoxin module
MKKIVLLFAALLVAGCGEKSSSEGSESASESATPPSEDVKLSADSPKPLISDADVERLLKGAIDGEAGFEEREDGRWIHRDGSGLLSGWVKWHEPEYGKGLQRFKDGKMDGPDVYWHENGQKASEVCWKDGEEDGPMTVWYEDGRLASEHTWDNGQLVAVAVWMPNGDKCANTKFENGTGIVYGYWENGQKSSEATYKEGEEDGPMTGWQDNGQKSYEVTYKDGQLDGLETHYYENGQKQLEVTYKDGKEDGPHTRYYENGQKMSEATLKDAKFNGLETMWHENGQKKSEVSWKDNVEVSAKYWNSKGEEVETEEEANEKPHAAQIPMEGILHPRLCT